MTGERLSLAKEIAFTNQDCYRQRLKSEQPLTSVKCSKRMGANKLIQQLASLLPRETAVAWNRWLRGHHEYRKLRAADWAIVIPKERAKLSAGDTDWLFVR